MALKDNIQLRSDTSSNFNNANPTLLSGETAFETDTGRMKLGNGSTQYQNLGHWDEIGPLYLPYYTTGTVPSASSHPRSIIWFESLGYPGYSDGTNWRSMEGSVIP